jgi:hypothetical protein
MIMLQIGGQPVTVMVEREQSEDEVAPCGYPVGRSVYLISWNDHQRDDSPTGATEAVNPRRWPGPPGTSGTSGSHSPATPPGCSSGTPGGVSGIPAAVLGNA